MRLRSRTLIFNQKIVLSIIKSTKLAHELGISNHIQNLQIQQIDEIMGHCEFMLIRKQTIIQNTDDIEESYYYFIVQGKIECIYDNGKRKEIKHGNYFINNGEVKWEVEETCIVGKIKNKIFIQFMKKMSTFIKKIELIEKSLPYKSDNMLFARHLLKYASTIRVRNNEYFKVNQKVVFFIIDGYCDIQIDNKVVARVSNCIVGQELLFKQEYDYKLKARSAYCEALCISAKILKIKLSNETIQKIKINYESKVNIRTKILSPKSEQNDQQNPQINKVLSPCLIKKRNKIRQLSNCNSNKSPSQQTNQILNSARTGRTLRTAHTFRTVKTTIQHTQQHSPTLKYINRIQAKSLKPCPIPLKLSHSKTQQFITHKTNNFFPIQMQNIRTINVVMKRDTVNTYISSNKTKLQTFGDLQQNIQKRIDLLQKMNNGQTIQNIYEDLNGKKIEKRKWIMQDKKQKGITTRRKIIAMMTNFYSKRRNDKSQHKNNKTLS